MSEPRSYCPSCKGSGMAHPWQKGAEDVYDRKAGTYEDRHLCAQCKGSGVK